jgi:hypothetical protein
LSIALLLTACGHPRTASGTGRLGGNGATASPSTTAEPIDQPTDSPTPTADGGTPGASPTAGPTGAPGTTPTTHGPAPVVVTLSAATPDHAAYTGLCGDHITFRVTISVNRGPTTVKYRWYGSDGSRTSSDLQASFPGRGAQSAQVTTTWDLGAPYTGWKELRVSSPTSVVSGRAHFASNCTRLQVAYPTSYPNPLAGTCPVTEFFKATLRVSGPLTVKYWWIRSDGAHGGEKVIDVPAGINEYPINDTWHLGGAGLTSYTGWEAIQFLSGFTGTSAHLNFSMTCTVP